LEERINSPEASCILQDLSGVIPLSYLDSRLEPMIKSSMASEEVEESLEVVVETEEAEAEEVIEVAEVAEATEEIEVAEVKEVAIEVAEEEIWYSIPRHSPLFEEART
jgi:hypothetical protein